VTERQTLYERVGGEREIAKLVDRFYARVLADPEPAPFFAEARMDRVRCMQTEFFAAALDGPVRYSGMDLAAAHAGRGIRPRHLARFVEHLLETLRERGLEEQDVQDIASRIHTYATDITGEVGVDG